MATTKITDLTAYTDPVNTDVLPIVDVTSDVTKKVSIANVIKNASLGTAAAPGISFDGDPNTGIYSPGADQVAVTTNGTQRLNFSSAGVVEVVDAVNISTGTTTGTKIGTATTQKLGFFNKTPVVQPAAVANATDAASVITQLNALLARLRDLGLIAT